MPTGWMGAGELLLSWLRNMATTPRWLHWLRARSARPKRPGGAWTAQEPPSVPRTRISAGRWGQPARAEPRSTRQRGSLRLARSALAGESVMEPEMDRTKVVTEFNR